MSEREDLRLERELREALRKRDPGPAPYGLRGRVDRVPEEQPEDRRPVLQRLAPWLAVAAALVVLVGSVAVVGRPGDGAAAGGPTPTTPAFDPRLARPGIVEPLDIAPLVLSAVLALLLLVVAVAATRGRRRVMVAAGAVALPVVLVGLQLSPAPTQGSSSGAGSGTIWADMPAGYSGRGLMYVTAAAGDPYWFGFTVRNTSPFPVRLDGFVEDAQPGGNLPVATAIWVDGAPEGGVTGPGQPFEAMGLAPGEEVVLWLVVQPGLCAVGPSWNSETADTYAYHGREQLAMRWSVVGWPRQDDFALPFDILEPIAQPCADPR